MDMLIAGHDSVTTGVCWPDEHFEINWGRANCMLVIQAVFCNQIINVLLSKCAISSLEFWFSKIPFPIENCKPDF